jgi:SAM-dependent methyltransferase
VHRREQLALPLTVMVGQQAVVFEAVPCNLCGSDLEEELFRGKDRLGLPGTFRVARCLRCGLLRQNPRPTSETIGAYYPRQYEPFSVALHDEKNHFRRFDRWYGMFKRRRLIEKHCSGGALLDVGCATGNFLAEMRRSGRWQVVGIEPNELAASEARAKHGLDVRLGRLTEVDLPTESFDVVTLWNVLEHLHGPIDDLRRISDWLKPGGWFVFSIPNLDSVDARLFGKRWVEWELPRHLYFFSRKTLEVAFDTLNFRFVERVGLSGGQISFAHSLVTSFPDRRRAPFWNRLAVAIVPASPARVAMLPLFYALARLGLTSTITAVARKRGQ